MSSCGRRGVIAATWPAVVAAIACGTIIAPAPPPTRPSLGLVAMVPGPPIVVAARAARTLQQYSFTTKRFSSDSTWGYRPADSTHIRLRYSLPRSDSTRVFVEYWGRCREGGDRCLRGLHEVIVFGLTVDEGPPQ